MSEALEKIVTELVEKRVEETLAGYVERNPSFGWGREGELHDALREKVKSIIAEELNKHELALREAISEQLKALLSGLKVDKVYLSVEKTT